MLLENNKQINDINSQKIKDLKKAKSYNILYQNQDNNFPFLKRKDTMYLSTINSNDFPLKKFKQLTTNRDWSLNLYNLDIEGSSPTKFGLFTKKVDFTNNNRDIEKSYSIQCYKKIIPNYSLTNKDIEGSQPKLLKINITRCTNPLNPKYNLPKTEMNSLELTKDDKEFNKYKFIRDNINIDDIEKKKYEELSCINVYGTLKAADNSKAGMRMNQNPEICSRWKGRIYLKINIKDCEYPIAGVQKNKDYEFINTLKRGIPRKYLWSLYIKLYSAFFLPTESDAYTIKMSVQESSETFEMKDAIQRNIDWNKCNNFSLQTFTPNLEELPDLLIYLLDKKKKEICFQRIKLSSFHLNDDIFVIKLFPEPCVNEVKEIYYSGLVKIKAKLFNSKIDPKEKCDTSAFKDGDEFGKNKQIIGLAKN